VSIRRSASSRRPAQPSGGGAAVRDPDCLFEVLGVDRVSAERQGRTDSADRVAFAEDSVAQIAEGVAEGVEPVLPRCGHLGARLVVVGVTVDEQIGIHDDGLTIVKLETAAMPAPAGSMRWRAELQRR
jgi:hypothetical protein